MTPQPPNDPLHDFHPEPLQTPDIYDETSALTPAQYQALQEQEATHKVVKAAIEYIGTEQRTAALPLMKALDELAFIKRHKHPRS